MFRGCTHARTGYPRMTVPGLNGDNSSTEWGRQQSYSSRYHNYVWSFMIKERNLKNCPHWTFSMPGNCSPRKVSIAYLRSDGVLKTMMPTDTSSPITLKQFCNTVMCCVADPGTGKWSVSPSINFTYNFYTKKKKAFSGRLHISPL